MCVYLLFEPYYAIKRRRMLSEMRAATDEIGAEILEFVYDTKCFGNIIFKFKKGDKIYKFVVDRDDIYASHDPHFHIKWHYPEEPYKKLIELIHEIKD